MGKRERIEKKTGRKQYKSRYYWYDENGIKHDGDTGWFYSKAEADKEARRIEKIRKDNVIIPNSNRRDRRVDSVFEDYITYLKEESQKDGKLTYIHYLKEASALIKNHTDNNYKKTKICDVNGSFFRSWLSSVNRKEDLGGLRVRAYKSTLLRFNKWLADNYYYLGDEEKEYQIVVAIGRVNLKKKTEHNKEKNNKRHVYNSIEFEKITEHYMETIYKFRSFYFYTLFHVLFFGGLREEELIALQWKNVDIENKHIYIENAITFLEPHERVRNRLANGINRTKNETSVRRISIFDFYAELLLDYKECYMYEYNLNEEQIKEAFVFPNLFHKDPYTWTTGKNLRYELKNVLEETGIPHSDIQMFRHSCATFLILAKPNGLGFTEEMVKDHFGHEDTTMLRTIYGKLNAQQKADRLDKTFAEYRTVKVKQSDDDIVKEAFIDRIKGSNERAIEQRKKRIYLQIDNAVAKKQKTWGYMPKDKKIIKDYQKDNPGVSIKFYVRKI